MNIIVMHGDLISYVSYWITPLFWIQSEHSELTVFTMGCQGEDKKFYWKKNYNKALLICSLSNQYMDPRMITHMAPLSFGSK